MESAFAADPVAIVTKEFIVRYPQLFRGKLGHFLQLQKLGVLLLLGRTGFVTNDFVQAVSVEVLTLALAAREHLVSQL